MSAPHDKRVGFLSYLIEESWDVIGIMLSIGVDRNGDVPTELVSTFEASHQRTTFPLIGREAYDFNTDLFSMCFEQGCRLIRRTIVYNDHIIKVTLCTTQDIEQSATVIVCRHKDTHTNVVFNGLLDRSCRLYAFDA